MSRFSRALLYLLVALWLPATLHCRLEGAGLLEAADECCLAERVDSPADACKGDACPTVEDALYKESAHTLKLVAPLPSEDLVYLTLLACLRLPHAEASTLSPVRFPPPTALIVGWQFLHRAAPPARAPGLNA